MTITEDLLLIKDIVNDLSGVGLWIAIGYIAMKIIIQFGWIYLARFLIEKVYLYLSADISREEANIIKESARDAERNLEREKHERKMEVEDLKHMYKILKEKNNDD